MKKLLLGNEAVARSVGGRRRRRFFLSWYAQYGNYGKYCEI